MKRIIAAVATLLLCLVGTTVSAQSGYQVKGVVVDAAGPVIGATVMEQGTQNGIATGLDGDYILNVSGPDATVEISCIGYKTQSFKASEVPAKIILTTDTEFLDDVVVIGYGTVKKSDMDRTELNKGKTGCRLEGVYAINPVNGKQVPVFIGDFVLANYGTGAVMAVPSHDQRDFEYAIAHSIPMIQIIEGRDVSERAFEKQDYLGKGCRLMNSEEFDGLTVEFAKKRHASVMVRGLRAVTDFENEIQLAQTNHALMPGIETMFLATSIKWSYLSSTIVKEAAYYGSDISKFVTPNVEKAVNEKYAQLREREET